MLLFLEQTTTKKKGCLTLEIVQFLLYKKTVYTSKVFQFQLTRKVAAKIDAPECVQTEQFRDLDGGKLDAISFCCAS